MQTVTVDALAAYLGVDAADDPMTLANLNMAAQAASMRLRGALGPDADLMDPRAVYLCLMWAADAYDERGTSVSAKQEGAMSRAERDIVCQLQLEARARRGEA